MPVKNDGIIYVWTGTFAQELSICGLSQGSKYLLSTIAYLPDLHHFPLGYVKKNRCGVLGPDESKPSAAPSHCSIRRLE